MESQLLYAENISRFAHLCDRRVWGRVLDQTGSFLPGCAGLGCVDQSGKPCGLVLISQEENGHTYKVEALCYHRKVFPQVGEALLRGLREYAALHGAEKLVYSYTVSMDTPDVDASVLRRCGWSEGKRLGALYRVINVEQLLASVEKLADGSGNVVSFFDVPPEMRARFSRRFGVDVDARLDYDKVWAPDPEKSLACVEGDELVGYVICTTSHGQLEVQTAYIDRSRILLLGTMLKKLASLCRSGQNDLKQIDIYTHTDFGDQITRKLLGQQPCQQTCFMYSEFELTRRD